MNYDEIQLGNALKRMIRDNDAKEFSRYASGDISRQNNYREMVEKFSSNGVINLINLFFRLNNIDYQYNDDNQMDEFVELFCHSLIDMYSQEKSNLK